MISSDIIVLPEFDGDVFISYDFIPGKAVAIVTDKYTGEYRIYY